MTPKRSQGFLSLPKCRSIENILLSLNAIHDKRDCQQIAKPCEQPQTKLENFSIYKHFKIFFTFDIIICISLAKPKFKILNITLFKAEPCEPSSRPINIAFTAHIHHKIIIQQHITAHRTAPKDNSASITSKLPNITPFILFSRILHPKNTFTILNRTPF